MKKSLRTNLEWARRITLVGYLIALAVALQACKDPGTGRLEVPDLGASPSGTAAAETLRFAVAVKGDWGAGTPQQAAVTQTMCKLRDRMGFEVVITTGDNFYRPDGRAVESNYFVPERCLYEHPGHRWMAAWGNHDVAATSTADVLGATERYYSWRLSNAEFFVLDSNNAASREQRSWLESALSSSRSDLLVVSFHHAPVTEGPHPPNTDVLTHWMPIFERHRVDLVLSGHNHDYEHGVVNDVDFVVTGGGGASVYPCIRDVPEVTICEAVHHFVLLEGEGRTLTVRAIRADGSDLDRFTIEAASR